VSATATLWLAALVAIAIVALLSAVDAAVLAVHAATAEDPDASSIGKRGERERSHRALAMGRVVGYVSAGVIIARALGLERRSATPGLLASTCVVVLMTLIVESGARELGHARGVSLVSMSAGVVAVVRFVFAIPVRLGTRLEALLNALIPPAPPNVEQRETSAEQFQEIIAAEAEVSRAEEELIHGAFSMGDTEVRAIMVPRVDVVGIDASTPWSEVLDRVRSSEHSRLPIYEDTLDNVVGILYAKDLLPSVVADDTEPANGWRTLAQPSMFIPVSKRIDAQLREFQSTRRHLAIVSDEYGGTAGLITIEDILEEIVGEIRDEYDVEEPEITQEGRARYWIAGRLPIADLAERLGLDIEVDNVTTVGGLVYELFGRVPRAGEAITYGGYRVVVERVRRRRIERVYFERLEHVTAGEDR